MQYNDSGAFGGDAGLTWNKTTFFETVTGNSVNGTTGFAATNTNAGGATQAVFQANNGTATSQYGITGTAQTPYGALGGSQPYFYSNGSAGLLFMADQTGAPIKLATNGNTETFRFTGTGILDFGSALDVGIGRNGAGLLEINNGTAGSYRDLMYRIGYIRPFSGGFGTGIKMYSNLGAELALRRIDANATTYLSVMPNGSVPTSPSVFQFFGTDYATDNVNFELLNITSKGSSDTNYRIFTQASGTGTRRPLSISADNTDTQMVFSTTGPISVGSSITGNGTVPAGGTTGQQLTKNSNTNYDVGWAAAGSGGGGTPGGSSGQLQYNNAGAFGGAPFNYVTFLSAPQIYFDANAGGNGLGMWAIVNGTYSSGFIQDPVGSFSVTSNTYFDGTNWKMDKAGFAALYSIFNGGIVLQTAPAAGAGANAALTTAFQVYNSRGVEIGNAADPGAGNLGLLPSGQLKWNNDTALARNAAGVLEINNGATGTYRDLIVRNLTVTAHPNLTTNGFVKTSGGVGTLSVDTASYQPADADLTTWAGVTPTSGIQTWLATPSSANLRSALTDENGTGAALFDNATTPTFTTGFTATALDSNTNGASQSMTANHNSTGTPTTGFGDGIWFNAETSGAGAADNQTQLIWQTGWSDSNHATRSAYMNYQMVNNASLTDIVRIHGVGNLTVGTTTNPSTTTGGLIVANTGYRIGTSAPTTNTILKSDGIKFTASTETYAAPGTAGNVMTSAAGNWTSAAPAVPVKVLWLTSGTTYTPSAGIRALHVECMGGGGGGGGAKAAASNATTGGGGGGGAYQAKWISGAGIKTSYSYAIGGGGAIGASTGTSGGTGVATTFDSASVCTANGGLGGTGSSTGVTAPQIIGGGGGGTNSGIGDVFITGSSGAYGVTWSASVVLGGPGGGSMFGGSCIGSAAGNAGVTGLNYGGGGGGASSVSATGNAGGAGAPGAIRITEYF